MNIKTLATVAATAALLAVTAMAAPAEARRLGQPGATNDGTVYNCATNPELCTQPGGPPDGGNHHRPRHRGGGGGGDFNFYFGGGYGGYGYYDPLYHPYYDDTFNTTLPMHCYEARMVLKRQGYRNVRTVDCQGRYYDFTGVMDGDFYRLRVNAYSGRVRARLIN